MRIGRVIKLNSRDNLIVAFDILSELWLFACQLYESLLLFRLLIFNWFEGYHLDRNFEYPRSLSSILQTLILLLQQFDLFNESFNLTIESTLLLRLHHLFGFFLTNVELDRHFIDVPFFDFDKIFHRNLEYMVEFHRNFEYFVHLHRYLIEPIESNNFLGLLQFHRYFVDMVELDWNFVYLIELDWCFVQLIKFYWHFVQAVDFDWNLVDVLM